ncbi:hypothetical protein L6Q21_09810 [Sandaracinobacter sp. RS1-74]|uniref:hypothetical protein n=1 Tax=Sandaracinobacteroides sayramensis TaxID=2913411 RepID=UPI001ED9CEAC|nr:hypothetical protein [Sandaracinobacteroides sayramensis]MCG2841275.1 hypothetical protein [Sandaracinobacteroides sayramensis]
MPASNMFTTGPNHWRSVFISGSRSFQGRLPVSVMDHLDSIIARKLPVLIGDAPGVDAAVQAYLAERHAREVTVFFVGRRPRHNAGGWRTQLVDTDCPTGTRAWRGAKDRVMCHLTDVGFVIWDGASAGSFANIRQLCQLRLPVVVYVRPQNSILTLTTDADRAAVLSPRHSG